MNCRLPQVLPSKIGMLIFAVCLMSTMLYAQSTHLPISPASEQVLLSGKVSNVDGHVLIGVTIKNLTTGLSTKTDESGAFKLLAANGSSIQFTLVGYKTMILDNQNQYMDVVLTIAETSLDEVVVTAIGIKQQKRTLGYATQEVKLDVIQESKTMNIGNALSGQVSGLTVNNPTGLFQKPNFSLRGQNPLIVVDGVPVESDFFDMSSANIENINVLKGTAASALYGSRGKNGAILISTKRAKYEGLELMFSSNTMVSAGFTVFPETQTAFGSGSNGKYEFWDGADGGISDGDMTWGPKLNVGNKVRQWNSPIRHLGTGALTPWWGDVSGTIYDDKSQYERVPTDWVSHNNLKDFLRTGIIQENNLSISYKGEKAAVFLTGKYALQRGQVQNTSLQTGGLNLNSSYQFHPSLKLDVNLSYNKVHSPNYPRYGYGPKNHIYTILLWMGNDVNGQELKEHLYVPGQEGYRQANYNYAWYNNPYFAANELSQLHDRNVFQGQSQLSWTISPKFQLQGRVSARNSGTFEDMKSPKSYMNYGDSRNGDYKIWDKNQLNFDADVLATYSETISENLGLRVNAGGSTFRRQLRELEQTTDGLLIPFVYSMGNTQGPVKAKSTLTGKEIRSVYASVNLDIFRSTYLNFSARNDWSSTLPVMHNSYFYPSISLSTILSDYFSLPKNWDYLKLYSSWASVSNDLDAHSITSIYKKDFTYGSIPSVTYPEVMVNTNIMPEKTSSLELGMSLAFFNNRIAADMTYYHVLDENQIIDLDISKASGFLKRKENGNQYRSNGVEVALQVYPIRKETFSWDFTLNYSKQVKKLTSIYDNQGKFGNLKVGDRADAVYETVWQRNQAGQLILNANGMPIRDPYVKNIGYTDPDGRFALLNRFKFADFILNVDIDGSIGGIINSVTHEKMWWGGKHPNSAKYRDAEYEAGKYVYVPEGVRVTGGEHVQDVAGNTISDTRTFAQNEQAVSWQSWSQVYPYQAKVMDKEDQFFANTFDRSFVKLRRLSIGYDLNKLIQQKKFKSLQATLFGYNLWMWKNIPYVDPDFGVDTDLQDPSTRYLGLSLSLNF